MKKLPIVSAIERMAERKGVKLLNHAAALKDVSGDPADRCCATCRWAREGMLAVSKLREELDEARAALREIDSTTVPSGFLRVWRERHPAALKAAREAK